MRVRGIVSFLKLSLSKTSDKTLSCNSLLVPYSYASFDFLSFHNTIKVQLHIVGAIAELAKDPRAPLEMLRCKGCRTLVDILNIPNEDLTSTAARAIAACAVEVGCRS